MKKLIAAIVIASVGAALAEQSYLVYDYKASIKRLDISAKYNKKEGVTQKFSVKSDTIIGYVTVPVCESCTKDDDDIDSAIDIDEDEDGYAYLTLKSNKKLVADKDYAVVKTPIKASIGVFGADQVAEDGDIVDEKKLNKAWMALDFPLPVAQLDDGTLVAKKNLSAEIPFGFLGIGNNGEQRDRIDVQNTGFGSAKILPGGIDFCGGKGNACLSVQSISGTLVGYPMHFGACFHVPMWDLCQVPIEADDADDDDDKDYMYQEVQEAVISGTWSLKFNKSLTSKYEDEGEDAILDKLGADDYVEIDVTGTEI